MPAGVPTNAAPQAASSAAAASGPATDIVMPQMGESIFEGTITKWLKNVGDKVQRDEPLFEISTDKVDAEIPAPASGVLTEITAQAGATVQVNAVVGRIGGAAGAAAPATPPAPVLTKTETPSAGAPAPTTVALQDQDEETTVDGQKIRSSPLVRKLAKEHGVNLANVKGTGLGGRITKEDIQSYVASPRPAAAAPSAPAAKPAAPAPAPSAPAPSAPVSNLPGEVVPMTAMRKIIAQRMVESKHT